MGSLFELSFLDTFLNTAISTVPNGGVSRFALMEMYMDIDVSKLDPDIAQLSEGLSGAGAPVFSLETIDKSGAMLDAFPAGFGGNPPEVKSVKDFNLTGVSGYALDVVSSKARNIAQKLLG